MRNQNSARGRLRALLDHPRCRNAITVLIIVNAVILGLQTSGTAQSLAGDLLAGLDRIILAVFVVELAAKMLARGRGFFRDPWGLFDIFVVAVALVPGAGAFAILRTLRVLRILRLVSGVESMRRVVGALLSAIPGMGSVIALLAIIYYVASVMATNLYGPTFPEWFGTIGASAYSLFQIMTLESWSMGIVRPVMEIYPNAWLFFILFLSATAFTVINLFIGIIVDAMQGQAKSERAETLPAGPDGAAAADNLAELRALLEEMRRLRTALLEARG